MGTARDEDDDLFGDDELDENLEAKGDNEDADGDSDETRAGKKKERGRLWNALQTKERENVEMRERLARLEGRSQAETEAAARARQANQRDELQDQIAWCDNELGRIVKEYESEFRQAQLDKRPWTEEDKKRHDQKHITVSNTKQELITKKVLRDSGVRPHNPDEAKKELLKAQYPDVFADERLQRLTNAHYQLELQRGGKDGPELVALAVKKARAEVRGGSGEPRERGDDDRSDRRESSYRGVSGAGGGGESRGAAGGSGGRSVKITKLEADLAEQRWPELSPAEAHKKHLATTGRKIRKLAEERGD